VLTGSAEKEISQEEGANRLSAFFFVLRIVRVLVLTRSLETLTCGMLKRAAGSFGQ